MFQHFCFDGQTSDKYEVVAVLFDKKPDTVYSAGLSSSTSTFFNKVQGTFSIVEQNYSEPMKFTLQVVNEDFTDFDTVKERDIKKWLCKRGGYSWFCVDAEGYENIFWKVNISNPKVLYVGKVVGMEFECTLDAPFGYSPKIERRATITDAVKSTNIYVSTDEDNYIYPYLEITMKQSGNLTITNSTELEHREFTINNVKSGEVITIDNSMPLITSSTGHNVLTDFNKHWLRLVDGNNKLTFNLNCTVLIRYREIRKVGIFA